MVAENRTNKTFIKIRAARPFFFKILLEIRKLSHPSRVNTQEDLLGR